MTEENLPDDVRFEGGQYVVSDPSGDYEYESKQEAVQHAKLMNEMSGKPGDLERIKYELESGEIRREGEWWVLETENFVVARRSDEEGLTYELTRKAGPQPVEIGEYNHHNRVIEKIQQTRS